jgi:transposase
MPSMPTTTGVVIGGVDCHADTHTTVALDGVGRRLADAQFPATAAGYQALLGWLGGFGRLTMVGVESTGSYGAGLTRHLRAQAGGVTVVEVNQPHPHTRRRRGKSDPVDAEAAARKALAGEATAVPNVIADLSDLAPMVRDARELLRRALRLPEVST